jgi:hypothetical protein
MERIPMYRRFQKHTYRPEAYERNRRVLDMKAGDVNGDGIIDKVYLYGNVPEGPGVFADNITLVIHDGRTQRVTTVQFQSNAGYNARLFLGDFDKDHILDILVSIDSGGSGGYGYFYMYSFKNNQLREMFNVEKYNSQYTFNVAYQDFYKVRVDSPNLQTPFIIDISQKGKDYLSQYYLENGKLKKPTKGEALALGGLYPIVKNEKNTAYDLLAYQRIIGTFNADTLGYIENHLTWKDSQFISSRLSLSVPGKLI